MKKLFIDKVMNVLLMSEYVRVSCRLAGLQDVPDASDRIFLFLECAVLDNCVDPNYIQRLPEKFLSSLSSGVLESNPQLETFLQKYAKTTHFSEVDAARHRNRVRCFSGGLPNRFALCLFRTGAPALPEGT